MFNVIQQQQQLALAQVAKKRGGWRLLVARRQPNHAADGFGQCRRKIRLRGRHTDQGDKPEALGKSARLFADQAFHQR
jgi:hypothetical protein